MKDCGSCDSFLKIKLNGWGGLCLFFDCRTFSDSGKSCRCWTGKKYIRKKVKGDNILNEDYNCR